MYFEYIFFDNDDKSNKFFNFFGTLILFVNSSNKNIVFINPNKIKRSKSVMEIFTQKDSLII